MYKRQLIKGTIINTQLLNDGFDFLILGNYFERADFTARIIDVKYFILLPSTSLIGTQIDNFQWSLMLRSVSSYILFFWYLIPEKDLSITHSLTSKSLSKSSNGIGCKT